MSNLLYFSNIGVQPNKLSLDELDSMHRQRGCMSFELYTLHLGLIKDINLRLGVNGYYKLIL